MLDLSNLNQMMEVKWTDGTVLHINEPKFKDLEQFSKTFNENEELEMVVPVLVVLLNNNQEGRVFTPEDMQELNLSQMGAVMNIFANFMEEVENDPK